MTPQEYLTLKGYDHNAIEHPYDRSKVGSAFDLFEIMEEYANELIRIKTPQTNTEEYINDFEHNDY